MDLSTVLSKVDLHQYGSVKEFLQDVDLIWQNALEYNPDRDPSGTHIVNSKNTLCSKRTYFVLILRVTNYYNASVCNIKFAFLLI